MTILPCIFVGHGSPFNLFDDNPFTRSITKYGKQFFQNYHPKAIIVISAHWLTDGSYVTVDKKPKMIYDYYGFPEKFYKYIYPAVGSSEIAEKISQLLPESIKKSKDWGIDHAATIVLEHLLPTGGIPIIEFSIDFSQPLEYHFELGRKLIPLREEGLFFVGSGNLIHTFREMDYQMHGKPFEWATELDKIQSQAIYDNNLEVLFNHKKASLNMRGFQTLDHYIPMLYILGMKYSNEKIKMIYEGIQHGSVSHRSFEITN